MPLGKPVGSQNRRHSIPTVQVLVALGLLCIISTVCAEKPKEVDKEGEGSSLNRRWMTSEGGGEKESPGPGMAEGRAMFARFDAPWTPGFPLSLPMLMDRLFQKTVMMSNNMRVPGQAMNKAEPSKDTSQGTPDHNGFMNHDSMPTAERKEASPVHNPIKIEVQERVGPMKLNGLEKLLSFNPFFGIGKPTPKDDMRNAFGFIDGPKNLFFDNDIGRKVKNKMGLIGGEVEGEVFSGNFKKEIPPRHEGKQQTHSVVEEGERKHGNDNKQGPQAMHDPKSNQKELEVENAHVKLGGTDKSSRGNAGHETNENHLRQMDEKFMDWAASDKNFGPTGKFDTGLSWFTKTGADGKAGKGGNSIEDPLKSAYEDFKRMQKMQEPVDVPERNPEAVGKGNEHRANPHGFLTDPLLTMRVVKPHPDGDNGHTIHQDDKPSPQAHERPREEPGNKWDLKFREYPAEKKDEAESLSKSDPLHRAGELENGDDAAAEKEHDHSLTQKQEKLQTESTEHTENKTEKNEGKQVEESTQSSQNEETKEGNPPVLDKNADGETGMEVKEKELNIQKQRHRRAAPVNKEKNAKAKPDSKDKSKDKHEHKATTEHPEKGSQTKNSSEGKHGGKGDVEIAGIGYVLFEEKGDKDKQPNHGKSEHGGHGKKHDGKSGKKGHHSKKEHHGKRKGKHGEQETKKEELKSAANKTEVKHGPHHGGYNHADAKKTIILAGAAEREKAQKMQRKAAAREATKVFVCIGLLILMVSIIVFFIMKARPRENGLQRINSRTALYEPHPRY